MELRIVVPYLRQAIILIFSLQALTISFYVIKYDLALPADPIYNSHLWE